MSQDAALLPKSFPVSVSLYSFPYGGDCGELCLDTIWSVGVEYLGKSRKRMKVKKKSSRVLSPFPGSLSETVAKIKLPCSRCELSVASLDLASEQLVFL